MELFDICKVCRQCCIGTEIRLIDEDVARWKKEDRLDILLAINPLIGGSRQLLHKKSSEECVFLKDDGSCEIHETKPYICRKFPTNRKHGEAMGCKAIDILFPIS